MYSLKIIRRDINGLVLFLGAHTQLQGEKKHNLSLLILPGLKRYIFNCYVLNINFFKILPLTFQSYFNKEDVQ